MSHPAASSTTTTTIPPSSTPSSHFSSPTSSSSPPPKISYLLPYQQAQYERHCFGINKLVFYEPLQILLSFGRDANIRLYHFDPNQENYLQFLDHYNMHWDWITDATFLQQNLITCSYDQTIMLWKWNTENRLEHLQTLPRLHRDYIKCVQPISSHSFLSAGFDNQILLWDLNQLSSESRIVFQPKHSIYSMTSVLHDSSVLCFTQENNIQLVDLKSKTKVCKIRGHQDQVKCILKSPQNEFIIWSGSSDTTIKQWDIRVPNRSMETLTMHQDAVNTLYCNTYEDMDTILLSGSRNGTICATNCKNLETVTLLQEEDSILNMTSTAKEYLFTCTTNSYIHVWKTGSNNSIATVLDQQQHGNTSAAAVRSTSLRNNSFVRFATPPSFSPSTSPSIASQLCQDFSPCHMTSPKFSQTPTNHMKWVAGIKGSAGIIRHHILNDRRHVLAQDTEQVITKWDVTSGKLVTTYPKGSEFEQIIKENHQLLSIPNWFTVERKLGSLEICLQYPSCFNAELYSKDLGFAYSFEEEKINMGDEVIRALFGNWLIKRRKYVAEMKYKKRKQIENAKQTSDENAKEDEVEEPEEEEEVNEVEQTTFQIRLQLPSDTLVSIHNNKFIKKCIKDFNEQDIEMIGIPKWVVEALLHEVQPSISLKLGFFLQSYDEKDLPNYKDSNSKLTAHRILKIKKVCSFVVQKLNLELPTRREFATMKQAHENALQTGSEVLNKLKPSKSNQNIANKAKTPRSTATTPMTEEEEKVAPDEYIEILCNGKVMENHYDLAVVNAFFKGNSRHIILQYRRKYNLR